VLAALGVAVGIVALTPPPSASATKAPTAPTGKDVTGPGGRYRNAEFFRRLQDDVGFSRYQGGRAAGPKRTIFGSSGRAQAWSGALDQVAERPVAGYGFGTEN